MSNVFIVLRHLSDWMYDIHSVTFLLIQHLLTSSRQYLVFRIPKHCLDQLYLQVQPNNIYNHNNHHTTIKRKLLIYFVFSSSEHNKSIVIARNTHIIATLSYNTYSKIYHSLRHHLH